MKDQFFKQRISLLASRTIGNIPYWSLLVISLFIIGCSSKNGEQKEEQIRVQDGLTETNLSDTSQSNSIQGNLSLSQIATEPNSVVLTGLPQHRLVTVYKANVKAPSTDIYSISKRTYYESYDSEREEHFMPGLDLIHGYNLLNVAHYDLATEQLNYLFDHPVLIKSLYYPSFIQDSLYKKPITRDYYLVSVYDTDTSLDTLLNKKDLRRLYYFNANNSEKIQLIPSEYSVVRSQYDPPNDVMYIFARLDANKNGMTDKKEPIHIFWLNLKTPTKAKRLY
jgi:hypothetical protein